MATQIRHVAIRSTSEEQGQRLADFYGSLFGMTQNNRTSDGYVWMSVTSHGLGRQAGPDHFGFEVDDIDAVMARSRAAYPQINFLKRPSSRPFAEIGSHDPAGNVFDLYQKKPGKGGGDAEERPARYLSHFQLRAVNPGILAKFYQEIYGLELQPQAEGDPNFTLTDGRVTMILAPWDIRNYADTGVVRPAIDHMGYTVESLAAFKSDLDELMESRPDLFPVNAKKDRGEGKRQLEILAADCHRGQLQLHDPDGWLLDVGEA
jgi:predicted enzyme related to lactoylglutathione lyase